MVLRNVHKETGVVRVDVTELKNGHMFCAAADSTCSRTRPCTVFAGVPKLRPEIGL